MLEEVSKGAWFVPMLLSTSPPLGSAQLELLEARPKLAAEFVAVNSARAGGSPELYSWGGGARWSLLKNVIKQHKRDKAALRAVVLRDTMLYVDDARSAADIYRFLGFPDLFDEPEIWLRRGDGVYRLQRQDKWAYVFADGVRAGERARLLIFDRVALDRASLEARVGWDLNRLRPTLALKAFRVERHGPDLLTGKAVLRGGGELEAAAFEREGVMTVAVVAAPEGRDQLLATLDVDRRGEAIKRGILAAADRMVGEELRFDEPKTEEGQQDGLLRRKWEHAYLGGQSSFEFNGDRYTVFTKQGAPNTPQVCIDFIYDTVERWSGRWWTPKAQGRHRTEGFINAEEWIGVIGRRQVSRLVASASEHPDKMEVLAFPASDRVPFDDTAGFYERLRRLGKDTLPGDIISIYGLKTDGRNHWHSFMIYDLDPIYNAPYLLVGQAGKARVQVWHDVMRSGPRRAITHRVRWRDDWLDAQRAAWLKRGESERASTP